MLFDLKKGNKTFERRYKKLIAQAKAEREGRTVEEADEDQNDDDDTEQDEQDDDYYGMQDHWADFSELPKKSNFPYFRVVFQSFNAQITLNFQFCNFYIHK